MEEVADKTRKANASALVCKALVDLISAFRLVDVWYKLKGAEKGHTFLYKGKAGTGSSRLDIFHTNPRIIKTVTNIQSKETNISDHKCLIVDVIFGINMGIKPKTSLWKINSAILKEDYCKCEFHDLWGSVTAHPLKRKKNIQKWWYTYFKPGLKNLCIKYCKNRTNLIESSTRRA